MVIAMQMVRDRMIASLAATEWLICSGPCLSLSNLQWMTLWAVYLDFPTSLY